MKIINDNNINLEVFYIKIKAEGETDT